MPPRRALTAALALAACASPPPPPRDAAADVADVALPNLTATVRFPLVQERVFTAASCDVLEGCTVPGRRRLMRFDLSVTNAGEADLALGAPTVDGRVRDGFEWGACHGHYHLVGFADFQLVTVDGRVVARGHKQSFCLEDTDRASGRGVPLPDVERFTCGRQGIHAGWFDTYDRSVGCQYVDITDVPPGRYRVRATVNPMRRIVESRYDDNVGELDVEVTPPTPDAGVDAAVDGGAVDPTRPCATSEQGQHRDCGWEAESAARRCAPGAAVTVACDAACGPPLGACAGDTMIRVCGAEAPCDDRGALAANDDACAADGARNPCSRVSFTCPASGAYRVLTGAYRAGDDYTCRVEAR